MYTYGTVIIKYLVIIKGYIHISCMAFFLILLKHVKTREPEGECCVS